MTTRHAEPAAPETAKAPTRKKTTRPAKTKATKPRAASQKAKGAAAPAAPEAFDVPLSKLRADPTNPRKVRSARSIESLAANIAAQGLLQNLVVAPLPRGLFAVKAGSRRHDALLLLAEQGAPGWTKDSPVRCVRTRGGQEAALSENVHREAMHPADEFEAWRALADDEKMTPEQIGQRHGVRGQVVKQRLALGRLAPEVLDALRADEITVEVAHAFTLTDDQATHRDVLAAVRATYHAVSANQVRSMIAGEEVRSRDKRAAFVGAEAYQAAGGTIRTDLFSDECYFQDEALLTRLAGEKLEAEADRLRGEGWGWITASMDRDYGAGAGMDRDYPQAVALPEEIETEAAALTKEAEDLEVVVEAGDVEAARAADARFEVVTGRLAEIEAMAEAYTPEQKAGAGGFIAIGPDGTLSCELGFKPRTKQTPRVATKDTAEAGGLSSALTADLKGLRRHLLAQHIAEHPETAQLLLTYQVATMTPDTHRAPLALRTYQQGGPAASVPNDGMGWIAEPDQPSAPTAWQDEADDAARFAAWCALPEEERRKAVALAVADLVCGQLARDDAYASPCLEVAAERDGFDAGRLWRPGESYFARLTKPQLLTVYAELYGEAEARKPDQTKAKKAELVRRVAETITGERIGLTEEQRARGAAWLPLPMRPTGTAD